MRRIGLLGLVLALGLTIGCGKSEEQKAAEKAAQETQEAAEALKKAAEQTSAAAATEGMAAAAKALEGFASAMSGKGPDGKPVEPVPFQSLQTLLPEVSGWQRGEVSGERMTSPVPFSQAEASYTAGDARVQLKVVDSAFNQMLVAPWAMFLTTGYEKESSSGYEKSVNIGGHPGFERWNKQGRDGELNLVVAKRFLVTVEGNDIAEPKVLHDFASKIDAAQLGALK